MLGEDIRWSGFPYPIILLNLAHSDCTQHCKYTQQPRVYLNLYHAYQIGLVCAVRAHVFCYCLAYYHR